MAVKTRIKRNVKVFFQLTFSTFLVLPIRIDNERMGLGEYDLREEDGQKGREDKDNMKFICFFFNSHSALSSSSQLVLAMSWLTRSSALTRVESTRFSIELKVSS